MLVHPQFDPVAIHLGPLAVRWYGLMYLVGFLLIWVAGHAVAVWVTKHDPAFLTVLSRHTRHKAALTC